MTKFGFRIPKLVVPTHWDEVAKESLSGYCLIVFAKVLACFLYLLLVTAYLFAVHEKQVNTSRNIYDLRRFVFLCPGIKCILEILKM
jgi:hypothetical protein